MRDWLANKVITKTIDGEEVQFRRVSAGTLQKFRTVGEAASKAIALLFKDTTHDIEVEEVKSPSQTVDPETGAPYMSSVFKQQAAHPSVLSMRKLDVEDGIKGIIRALTEDESMDVLSEIIVKSAWKEFEESDIETLKDKMDLITMIEFLKGAFEASAGDYAKLGKSWFQSNTAVQTALGSLTGAMDPPPDEEVPQ